MSIVQFQTLLNITNCTQYAIMDLFTIATEIYLMHMATAVFKRTWIR